MSEPYEWTDASGVTWSVDADEKPFPVAYYKRDGKLHYAGGANGSIAAIRELVRLAAEVSRLQTEIEQWRAERNRLAAALAETTTREEAGRERVAAMRAHLLTRGHKADCTWPHPSYGPDYGCSCGWLAALGEEAKDG